MAMTRLEDVTHGLKNANETLSKAGETIKDGMDNVKDTSKSLMSSLARSNLRFLEAAKEAAIGPAKGTLLSAKNFALAGGAMMFKPTRDMVGGITRFLGGAGKFGLTAGAVAIGLSVLSNFDVKFIDKFVDGLQYTVTALHGIMEDLGGVFSFTFNTTAFGMSMAALGGGLAKFAMGATMAGGAMWILDKFSGDKHWTERITDNVKNLMTGMSETLGTNKDMLKEDLWGSLGGATAKLVGFPLAMYGIGYGLRQFGMGAVFGAVGEGAGAVLERFTGDTSWSQRIVRNVDTLITGISNIISGPASKTLTVGDRSFTIPGVVTSAAQVGAFGATMWVIGAGLATFGAGLAAAAGGMAAGRVYEMFTGESSWSLSIVKNVDTLVNGLSNIIYGADPTVFDVGRGIGKVGSFLGTMGAIGAGLAVFGTGSLIAAFGSGSAEAVARFSGETSWTSMIRSNVKSLIETAKMASEDNGAGQFLNTMTLLAEGLSKFGSESLLYAIKNGLTEFVKVLPGIQDPIRALSKMADELDIYAVNQLARVVDTVASALERLAGISNIDLSKIQFQKFAKDLNRGMPHFERAMFGSDKIKGFANYGSDYDKGVENLSKFSKAVSPAIRGEKTATNVSRETPQQTVIAIGGSTATDARTTNNIAVSQPRGPSGPPAAPVDSSLPDFN